MPSARSAARAFCAVARLIFHSAASSRSDGSRSPGLSDPLSICARRAATTCMYGGGVRATAGISGVLSWRDYGIRLADQLDSCLVARPPWWWPARGGDTAEDG